MGFQPETSGDVCEMALTFRLLSVRDLFDKLRRDAAVLDEEVTSDRLFNFVITGHSMIDWVAYDPTVPPLVKVDTVIKGLKNDPWLKVCGDLANGCKHFILTQRKSITASAPSMSGFGAGRYGKGGYGAGEESIVIQLKDGTAFDCLDLVSNVLSTWEAFFNLHGL